MYVLPDFPCENKLTLVYLPHEEGNHIIQTLLKPASNYLAIHHGPLALKESRSCLFLMATWCLFYDFLIIWLISVLFTMFSLNPVFVIDNLEQTSLTFIFARGCGISLGWIPRGSLLIEEHALCWRLCTCWAGTRPLCVLQLRPSPPPAQRDCYS